MIEIITLQKKLFDFRSEHITIYYDNKKREILASGAVFEESGVFVPEMENYNSVQVRFGENAFLSFIASMQSVEKARHKSDTGDSLVLHNNLIRMDGGAQNGVGFSAIPISSKQQNFLFLDALSVIEDSYHKKKEPRDIELSTIESHLLNLVEKSPDIIHSYQPRSFEYFVASLLTKIGFSRVKLSRYWNDSGRDIWAVYCEGDTTHDVVVEVKHYTKRKVGIEIVDRLNGVRDRDGVSKGMVVTNSSFSKPALDAYEAVKDRIALVDYDRLIDLLSYSGNWIETPSGLWTPRQQSGTVIDKGKNENSDESK